MEPAALGLASVGPMLLNAILWGLAAAGLAFGGFGLLRIVLMRREERRDRERLMRHQRARRVEDEEERW